VASALFAAIVLLAALPWSTLLGQHAQMAQASAELAKVEAENHALVLQTESLANRATQAGLAQQDYGLVSGGETGYEVLPAPGSAPSAKMAAGQVPLDEPPVVPGSTRSEELLAGGVLAVSPRGHRAHPHRVSSAPASSGGFWSRVAHTLEFWG
jgi:hypothetical protein